MADLQLTFKGRDYVLPEAKFFRTMGAVEDVALFFEITEWHDLRKLKVAKLSEVYAIILRAAGAVVTPDEVAAEIQRSIRQGGKDAFIATVLADVSRVIGLLFDGAPPNDGGDAGEPKPGS